MSFFKTVVALCSGVSVFLKLLSVPLWRMVLHTILMMLISSLIITTVTWSHDKTKIIDIADRFFEKTEGVLLTENSLTLPKDPESARHYILGPYFRFDYFANTEQINLQCIESARETSGVICLPAGCVVWARDKQLRHQKCMYILLPVDKIYHQLSSEQYEESITELRKVIDQFAHGNGAVVSVKTLEQEVISFAEKHQERLLQAAERTEQEDNGQTQEKAAAPEHSFLVQANQIVPFLLIMQYLMTFTFTFTEILMLVLMAGIFMTLAQYFRSAMYPCKLTWKQAANITLYSTFPPMLIASLFTAFQLPFVTFQMIFFITFFIYQITAFGFVIHFLNPMPERSDDDFDF